MFSEEIADSVFAPSCTSTVRLNSFCHLAPRTRKNTNHFLQQKSSSKRTPHSTHLIVPIFMGNPWVSCDIQNGSQRRSFQRRPLLDHAKEWSHQVSFMLNSTHYTFVCLILSTSHCVAEPSLHHMREFGAQLRPGALARNTTFQPRNDEAAAAAITVAEMFDRRVIRDSIYFFHDATDVQDLCLP